MKKALFATTAAAALAAGGMASAQEITLFGDARLGLGYNVSNDGDFVADTDEGDPAVVGDGTEVDDLRAISRVRFGVRMTGETPTGITFGATIRADNAIEGEGNTADPDNQTAGSVFVSGVYGTLTFGDIDEAHQNHVGDLPELGLTGLTLANEYPYLGNREGGTDYRPTVRYDYDLAGFGVSLSTGTQLDSIGVGASYALDFGGGAVTIGAGYFDVDTDELADEDTGNQWAVGLEGAFGDLTAEAQYIVTDTGTDDDDDILGVGLGTAFGAFGVNAFYRMDLEDDDESYGADFTYDLGGGARLKGGAVRTLEVDDDLDDPLNDLDNEWVADFGITMAF